MNTAMTPREQYYYDLEKNKDHEELLLTVVKLMVERDEYIDYGSSNADAITAMHKQFIQCQKELEEARAENKELKEALVKVSEKEKLRVNDIFGRGTEKLADLLEGNNASEVVDEAETEESGELRMSHVKRRDNIRTVTPHGRRSAYRAKKADLDRLPQQSRFILDTEKFDKKYGSGNWCIVYWKNKRTVEIPRATAYCLNTYTPVLSVGLEHDMKAAENPGMLPGSFVSPSFLAYTLYERLFLSLPFYRLSESFSHMGLDISRQTLNGWFIRFAETHFSLVYDRLREMLMTVPYHQCDETFTRVIHDGRDAGTSSYMWVHRTSELWPGHQMILYCFELTRGTDHLRKFYEDFRGFITCDAYCSYRILESENSEVIRVCGCMMHLRRRFAESLSLIDRRNLTDEALDSLPETRALKLIGKIYDEDERLKNLDASRRKKIRAERVKPLVEEFYAFMETIPDEDPLMGNRLKDAVKYAKNQKEYLCRFLEDGTVPIDDGATERAIRDFAISKKNSLFFNTVRGAEAAAIMYSILETSKANGVNFYLYLQYLLEVITVHLDDKDTGFLDACLPWSEEYAEYEKRSLAGPPGSFITGEPGVRPELPRTPGNKRTASITSGDTAA